MVEFLELNHANHKLPFTLMGSTPDFKPHVRCNIFYLVFVQSGISIFKLRLKSHFRRGAWKYFIATLMGLLATRSLGGLS